MANILTEINACFDTAIAALQVAHPEIPLSQKENVQKRLGDGFQWIRVTILPATSVIETLGPTGITRSQGIVQVDVFYPNDEGAETARLNADTIMNWFQPGKQLVSNGVNVLINNVYPLPAFSIKNNYQLPVRIEYSSWNSRTII